MGNDQFFCGGAWEKPMRLSLLRNRGDGRFDDVTVAAGLAETHLVRIGRVGRLRQTTVISTCLSAASISPHMIGPRKLSGRSRTSRCRLYHNEGDGTFVDVALAAGVAAELCSKGFGLGRLRRGRPHRTFFVSNYVGRCCLFHNDGNGKFPRRGRCTRSRRRQLQFSPPGFWDYDNDGPSRPLR